MTCLHRSVIILDVCHLSEYFYKLELNELSPVAINDKQTPSLRSDHLNINDAQCAENKDGLKISYHIITCLGTTGVQKGRFGRPKVQFSSKVAKFARKIGIDLTLIFLQKLLLFY